MHAKRTRLITVCGLFISAGILIPMVFHAFGLGKVFLPMHIPVLIAGILYGPEYGLITGLITPGLSALLTGMPPLMPPTAQAMTFELAAYGVLSGLLAHRFRLSVVLSLVGAMVGGRLVYGLLGASLLLLLGFPSVPVLYPLTAGLVSSLPGVVLQLAVVPVVVALLGRHQRRL
ncbi:MAG: ECF transporter S component [Bacillota bacterium]|nr:ECF transporter S component [Bacillota bacterium]